MTDQSSAIKTDDLTRILNTLNDSDSMELDSAMQAVYSELSSIAKGYLARERRNHTLRTGALVNEAFIRVASQEQISFRNRAHFYAISARIMRQVLVDHAREHRSQKRGGNVERLFLEDIDQIADGRAVELLQLDESLRALAQFDQRKSQMVELRFFGGMTIEETAEILGFSPATLKREWVITRAWLRRDLIQRMERAQF